MDISRYKKNLIRVVTLPSWNAVEAEMLQAGASAEGLAEAKKGFEVTLRKPNQIRLINNFDLQPLKLAVEKKLKAEDAPEDVIAEEVAKAGKKDERRLAGIWLIDCCVSPRLTRTAEEAAVLEDAICHDEIDELDFAFLCEVLADWAGLSGKGDLALAATFPDPDNGGSDIQGDGDCAGAADQVIAGVPADNQDA